MNREGFPPSAPLECSEIESWQALFTDLPAEQRQAYERHLESCPACQERLDRAEGCDNELRQLVRRAIASTAHRADPALMQALQRLHETDGPERTVVEAPAELYFLQPDGRAGVLGVLGAFEVLEVIGRGGMGAVLKAFDPALERPVAIKVLAAGVAGSAVAQKRFAREAKAAAAVCHEHIVAVHGVFEADGLPYLVMQYIEGESLQDRLDRTGALPVEEVVRIGMEAALGLAAAHGQGLIHRDIKPANLLLCQKTVSQRTNAAKGANGSHPSHLSHSFTVKITDFGLARLIDDAALTQNGVVAGTPEYMAPEQARGETVDHRADLFGLGSVLYAMCTGAPPFSGSTSLAVLRQVADHVPPPIRTVNPDAPAWLETLIARLMAKDPGDRFQNAAEVAALLQGYLAHLRQPASVPAPSLPATPRGRIGGRWVALALFAVLGLGVGGWLVQGGGGPRSGKGPPGPAASPEVDEKLMAVAFSPDGTRLATGGGWYTEPGQLQIWDPASAKPLFTRREFHGVRAACYSPDGKVLATGHWGGDVRLRDPLTGAERAVLTGHEIGVGALAFSPDGALLATAGLDKTVKLWDVQGLRERRTFIGHEDKVGSVAYFHRGGAFLTGSQDRTIRIWDAESGQERSVWKGHSGSVEALAVSPDDKLVASGGWDRSIRLWDAATGQTIATLRQTGTNAGVQTLAFSPDGLLLASGSADGTVYFWDVPARKLIKSLRRHDKIIRGMAFSPDGKLLATASEDCTARLWDVAASRDAGVLSPAVVEASPDEPAEGAPKAGRGALWAAGFLIFTIMAASLGLALLGLRNRRSRKGPPPPPAPEPRAKRGPPVFLSATCSECGKTIKIKADLAGKKVRCPGCGKAVHVPPAEP